MKTVRELRKKAAKRVGMGKQVLSTSEARANFAEALETAQVGGAVIGFDRYGRTIAALVPVEAVYMLAGQGGALPASVRAAIVRQAKSFVENVPSRMSSSTTTEPKRAGAKGARKKGSAKAAKKARRRARG
jgi:antitoxin (DNA-binding transcriptional repressor) of toxin-antitoxin stability system